MPAIRRFDVRSAYLPEDIGETYYPDKTYILDKVSRRLYNKYGGA